MSESEQGGGNARPHAVGAQDDYFTYTDAGGVQVIVGRLADVPQPYRAQAKHIDLTKPALRMPSVATGKAGEASAAKLCLPASTACVHATSFLIGAAVALVLGGVGVLAFRKAARLVTLVAGIVVVGALVAAYLTAIRRAAGLPGDGLATPARLIDDSRAAAKAMEDHYRQQAGSLDPPAPRR